METRERGTAAPASGKQAELDWRELGRRVRRMRQAELLRGLPRDLLATMAPRLRRANARAGELDLSRRRARDALLHRRVGQGQPDPRRGWRRREQELGPGASCGDAVLWAGAATGRPRARRPTRSSGKSRTRPPRAAAGE